MLLHRLFLRSWWFWRPSEYLGYPQPHLTSSTDFLSARSSILQYTVPTGHGFDSGPLSTTPSDHCLSHLQLIQSCSCILYLACWGSWDQLYTWASLNTVFRHPTSIPQQSLWRTRLTLWLRVKLVFCPAVSCFPHQASRSTTRTPWLRFHYPQLNPLPCCVPIDRWVWYRVQPTDVVWLSYHSNHPPLCSNLTSGSKVGNSFSLNRQNQFTIFQRMVSISDNSLDHSATCRAFISYTSSGIWYTFHLQLFLERIRVNKKK